MVVPYRTNGLFVGITLECSTLSVHPDSLGSDGTFTRIHVGTVKRHLGAAE